MSGIITRKFRDETTPCMFQNFKLQKELTRSRTGLVYVVVSQCQF